LHKPSRIAEQEEQMRRVLTAIVAVFGCVAMLELQAQAQTSESKTKIKTDDAKTMTFSGCVQTGTDARTYMLQHVVPVSTTTEPVGTGGTVTTTSYVLVPEKVQLQEHVGHKVEVTGVLIPAGKGDSKIETRTKTGGAEEKTKAEIERGPVPQLKVISVKTLADRCS
jgi:hypothetical protein